MAAVSQTQSSTFIENPVSIKHAYARPSRREDFEVAIICALRLEFDAVAAIFDDIYHGNNYGRAPGDFNHYTSGLIGNFNVVLVLLPGMGKVSAASAAASFRSSYTGIKLTLIVGICGAVPFTLDGKEILLGDVVLSRQVVQYDYGRQYPHGYARKDTQEHNLARPNQDIRGFVDTLQTRVYRRRLEDKMEDNLHQLQSSLSREQADIYRYPGTENDQLFEASYRHKHYHPATCEVCSQCLGAADPVCEPSLVLPCREVYCDMRNLVARQRIKCGVDMANDRDCLPEIHFGAFGSGDTVMKSAHVRDEISKRDNIIAFEMEGAGVWDNLSCIIIKGACDYADSHKNKVWQNYAAAAAASTAKAVIELYPQTDKLVAIPVHPLDSYRAEQTELVQATSVSYGFVLGQQVTTGRLTKSGSTFKALESNEDGPRHLITYPTSDSRQSPALSIASPANDYGPLKELRESCFGKPRNLRFTGRNNELDEMSSFLSSISRQHSKQVRTIVVHGLGGVGKTQLVTEYCHLTRERQPETAIFWFTASSANKLELQYKEIAHLLAGYAQTSSAEKVIKDLVRMYNRPGNEIDLTKNWITSHQSWLVVMDNYDDISFDTANFIPNSPNGTLIYTSRNKRLAVGFGISHSIKLDEPSKTDAALLFLRLCSETDIDVNKVRQYAEYREAMEIVKSLHGFPLALSQAAAYIRANSPFSCTEYLDLLTSREEEDREFLLKYMPDNSDYPKSVMATWEISLDYLHRRDPDCAKLLQLLGFFASSDIPIDILGNATEKAIWSCGTYRRSRGLTSKQSGSLKFLARKARFNEQVGLLLSLSLIVKHYGKRLTAVSNLPGTQAMISVHPLVHEWIRVRLKPRPEEAAEFAHLSGLILYQAYPLSRYPGLIYRAFKRTTTSDAGINPDSLRPHLTEVIHNIGRFCGSSTSSFLEIRTLMLAMSLNDISGSGSNVIIPRLWWIITASSPFWVAETDYLGSFQVNLSKAAIREQGKTDVHMWIRIMAAFRSWFQCRCQLPTWDSVQVIYITVSIALVAVILDWDWNFENEGSANVSRPNTVNPEREDAQSSLKAEWNQYMKSRATKILLDTLSFLLLQGDSVPAEIPFLIGMLKCRLAGIISLDRYSRLRRPFMVKQLESDIFKHIEIHEIAMYFDYATKLHPPMGLEVRTLIRVTDVYARVMWDWKAREDNRSIYQNKYISSSFGRQGHRAPGVPLVMANQLEEVSLRLVKAADERELELRVAIHHALKDGDSTFELQDLLKQVQGSRENLRYAFGANIPDGHSSGALAKKLPTLEEDDLSPDMLQITDEQWGKLRISGDRGSDSDQEEELY